MFSLLLVAGFVNVSFAQVTNTKIEWDYLATTIAEVQGIGQSITVDNIPVPGISCAATGPNVTCSVTVTPALTAGIHTLKLDATRNGITKTTAISGLNPASAPKDPSNFRYSIQINITVQ